MILTAFFCITQSLFNNVFPAEPHSRIPHEAIFQRTTTYARITTIVLLTRTVKPNQNIDFKSYSYPTVMIVCDKKLLEVPFDGENRRTLLNFKIKISKNLYKKNQIILWSAGTWHIANYRETDTRRLKWTGNLYVPNIILVMLDLWSIDVIFGSFTVLFIVSLKLIQLNGWKICNS